MLEDVNGIRGLTLVRDYITDAEEADLLDMIDAVEEVMAQRGNEQVLARLATVRQEAERVLG